ncbi:putative bifunctional diguanylate cyclase/phosphodiesterase [Pseudoduganella umbonata]|uniref:EAL domain-containing protein n=1 Tax=Pseudoduganella umbonata TaxID=864828 RepID=A0A4P8HK90_9BURK|nr:EAL domain-containing protein [Pseudoduganella umbonata]MBB3220171.1 EAL domain-containing protein (putative c-di-GMP-specific phosphodiesterase class I)/GGDEF domain-containing protein [Pseudoduganella umbonata]QCP10159.1 EAL domain-containing protein [Pseudoduganella umbonata]
MTCHTEAARLDTLRKLDLLDTPPSEAFDRITRMAAQVFGLPIAAVSLTDSDRQWFKSRVGIEHWTIPRLRAPCATVADTAGFLVIPDLLDDPHFRDSHLARNGVRFYAGAPLTTRDGHALGAMCVLGTTPRQITQSERDALTDLAAMAMSQIELQHAMGRIDPISGLPNRNQYIDDMGDLEKDRPAGEARLAVLVHLANPEQLANAARVMGSSYVDRLVTEAVRSFRAEFGAAARMYHVAATQFIVVMAPELSLDDCRVRIERWLQSGDAWSTSRFVTSPAAGIAPFAVGRTDALDVLRTAQGAVHDAYAAGAPVAVYSPAEDAAWRRRFTLLTEFGNALAAHDQLRLVYQPRIDLANGACVGAEALLRWTHPELGGISPGEFMPIVEQTSMARPATAWIVDAALRQLRAWQDADIALTLSVNVAAPNLLEPDFALQIVTRLQAHGVTPDRLELEITESAAMGNQAAADRTLAALHAAGVRIAIDDFGTGYSSLAYLQSIPAHVVKIDQGFVRGIEADARKRALVAAMASLSHDLGYRVVAEGVETAEAAALVRAAGCDEAQGWLYARALEPAQFALWYREAAAH